MSAKCLISGDIGRVFSVKLELSSFLTISFDEVSLNDLSQERSEDKAISWSYVWNLQLLYLECQSLTNTSNVHSYNIRNSVSNCHIPRPKTDAIEACLHCRGSVLMEQI